MGTGRTCADLTELVLTVYYRMYNAQGAVRPHTCFDDIDRSLGRIWVSPPCAVVSIKRWIAKEEHLDNSVDLQLYGDSRNITPLDHSRILDFGDGFGPGSPDEPLGLNIVTRHASSKSAFRKLVKAKWDGKHRYRLPSFQPIVITCKSSQQRVNLA